MRNSLRSLVFFAVVALASPSWAHADILASYTSGTTTADESSGFYGTRIHTGPQGPAHDLQFTFLAADGTTHVASGTIFLLSSPYAGTPTALSSSTAGFVDAAYTSGGIYAFNPATTVQADTDYYVYSATNGMNLAFGTPGGATAAYYAYDASSNFATYSGYQFNHQLTGTVGTYSVPEPSTMAMALSGLVAAGIAIRRRRTVA